MTAATQFAHIAAVMWLAVIADRLFGDPRRLHPLAGFGWLASELEARVRASLHGTSPDAPPNSVPSAGRERAAGILCVALLILPAGWLSFAVTQPSPVVDTLFGIDILTLMIEVLILYFCIASRSLEQHAYVVLRALSSGDLVAARAAIGRIVSRDTATMEREDIARAAVESVLENGNDAVFGALFWFVLLWAPGALMFRFANTLDAMWGYRNARYLNFGWAAARLDDVLNFIPARLTAAAYCLAGNWANGWRCWREQARHWYSPNAGPVMAAGAGALSVVLGGRARYGGEWKDRPLLGRGHEASPDDIAAAIGLLRRSLALWLIVITLFAFAAWALGMGVPGGRHA